VHGARVTEREQAVLLANRVLEKPYIDADGDICLLARQFLRAIESHFDGDPIAVYSDAVTVAHSRNQVVGEKSDYYVTLEQLERLLMLK